VVHVAWPVAERVVRALGGVELPTAEIEIFNDGDMPRMQCTARAAMAAGDKGCRTVFRANLIELGDCSGKGCSGWDNTGTITIVED